MATVKNLKIGSTTYDVNATYLEGHQASYFVSQTNFNDHLSKFSKLQLKIVTSLPAASDSTRDAIYLIAHAHSDGSDSYDEYLTVLNDTTYSWEKIGNTDVDLTNYIQKNSTTSSSKTGITASLASTPTFTGSAHTHGITEPNSGKGHSHGYDKVTSATFNGAGGTTGGSGTGITAALSNAPTFTGNAHSHSVSEPNKGKGHVHGYDKVTGIWPNNSDKSSGGSTTGITATSSQPGFSGSAHSHGISEPNSGKGHVHGYDKVTNIWANNGDTSTGGSGTGITATSSQPSFSGAAHSHSITEPNSGTGHSHGYDKVTNIWAGTTAATTGGSGTGITASSSAPGFTGSSHSHTASDSGHAHGYTRVGSASCAGWNISVDGTTLIFAANTGVTLNNISDTTGSGNASISVSSTTAGGSVSAPTITINDPGHSHGYTAPTGNCGWTYNEGKTTQTSTSASTTGIGINSTTAGGTVGTPTITIKDPGHSHTYNHTNSIGWQYNEGKESQTATAYSTTGIGINNATAGGSVSTPTITINDPGHSHTYNHTDSVGWTYNDGKDTQATTSYSTTGIGINSTTATGSVSKPDVKITDPGHSHSFTPSGNIGLTYNSGTTTQAQTAQSTTGIGINNTTAGGSVSKPDVSVNDPGHTHVEQ